MTQYRHIELDQKEMRIRFAAVHAHNSWRAHAGHSSLAAAITGRDGAENLLKNRLRAVDRTADIGPAHAVFVWDVNLTDATALRIKPGSYDEIERMSLPANLLASFEPNAGPSLEQIDQWFTGARQSEELRRQDEVRTPTPSQAEPALLVAPVARRRRYGSRTAWELVVEAVQKHEHPVSVGELASFIVSDVPEFKVTNLAADLSMLSVNCFSRGNYAVNRRPRRTDTGSPYDKLVRLDKGRGVRFTLYDPEVHGVWELMDLGHKVLRPRFVRSPDFSELEQARIVEGNAGLFDPSEDARRRTLSAIVRREGQPAFRRSLLDAYNRRCAISGCAVEALLEAAHIVPYRGVQTNLVTNGLLLRADLHKLFDLHLLGIDPVSREVYLSDELQQSEYAKFNGVPLHTTINPSQAPSAELLAFHLERCGWMHASRDAVPRDE